MTVQPQGGRLDRASGTRTRKTTKDLTRGDRGVALVEFAIIMPLLMCLLLGMLTGGAALAKKIDITDAVREGARFGATIEVTDPENSTQVAAWADKVKGRIVGLSGGRLATADICAALVKSTNSTSLPAAGTAATCFVDVPGDSAGDYIVHVRGASTVHIEAFFFSRSWPVEAKTAARYERD
jgi:Flp pilus assembly protein TadG